MLKCILLDGIFLALSDPTRRFMLEVLCDGELSAGELAEPFPLELSTVLWHLRVLEQNGLIHTEKLGHVRRCCIDPQGLRLLDEWVTQRRKAWDPRLRRL
ncbi:MAG TPA: metalloregulator ArsR/SmtB family transcription factor [Steroidobacteraceae bacterium]|nr:metalloregulator ArsR/SmtB family transcription factor [Steroidobacteraceae bacterium]